MVVVADSSNLVRTAARSDGWADCCANTAVHNKSTGQRFYKFSQMWFVYSKKMLIPSAKHTN